MSHARIQAAFIDALASSFDRLRAPLAEHKEDNFGELLPDLFFGDIVRAFYSSWPEPWTKELLIHLDDNFDPALEDGVSILIANSFVENLDWGQSTYQMLVDTNSQNILGYALRRFGQTR